MHIPVIGICTKVLLCILSVKWVLNRVGHLSVALVMARFFQITRNSSAYSSELIVAISNYLVLVRLLMRYKRQAQKLHNLTPLFASALAVRLQLNCLLFFNREEQAEYLLTHLSGHGIRNRKDRLYPCDQWWNITNVDYHRGASENCSMALYRNCDSKNKQ